MELEAKERQTGVYGTVNKGDVVTVSDDLGKELLEIGNFKEAEKSLDMATPEEVIIRNNSGLSTEPAGFDGTEREAKNTVGLHLVHPDGVTESAQEDKEQAHGALVEKATQNRQEASESVAEKQEKVVHQTKEDKAAAGRQTK